ncbi:MAG TPA: FAD-binding oxidoreductase [Actinomycetota bacterium]|jgi:glycine/D-amino acid oxidase-like deaminating enzyme|nr:FAD-binding oxidoreductase [Actinomycetota bacterium]
MTEAIPRSPLTSYWLREALGSDPFESRPRLSGDASADVVIVGGGYTGLWTAWFLTERAPGIDIVLLDADRCGFGPSGRNGGFVTGWWDEADDLVARYGDEPAVRACRALSESTEAIGEWCRVHGVDAWHTKAGWIGVASAPAQEGVWRVAVETCRRLDLADELRDLSSHEVNERCRSPVFGGGVFMRDGATVQPARLALGLRRLVLQRGVRIFEGSRVLRAAPERTRPGSGLVAETAEGRVRAGRAVLSMGPWGAAWPGLRRAVVVRGSYILMTSPAPERLEEIGWTSGVCISDYRTTLHYFRTTRDGRVAFGGPGRAEWSTRASAKHDFDEASVIALRRDFLRFFPSFRDVPVEEAWGGPVDVSSLHHPMFGTLAPGTIHYALGYTGNGVGPSHLGGRVLSAMATGADEPVTDLPMVNQRPLRFPPTPLTSVGAFVVQAAIARKERAEDDGARAGPLTRFMATLPRRMGYALGPKP